MIENKNHWLDQYQDYWCCTRHKDNSKRPGVDSVCWKYFTNGSFCHSHRPIVTEVLYEAESCDETENKYVLCDYERCSTGTNGEKGFAIGKSKYCSPNCRKRKARDKYRLTRQLETTE